MHNNSEVLIPWARRIQEIRMVIGGKGYTQKDFSFLTGISLSTLRKWEQGVQVPGPGARTLILLLEKYPQEITKLLATIDVASLDK